MTCFLLYTGIIQKYKIHTGKNESNSCEKSHFDQILY